jgi:branched-chain amino acid transport system permease protein
MVILGGVGTLWGGVIGAAALLLMQEVLSARTEYWEFWIGWVLLAVVLFARNGLVGLLQPLWRRKGPAPKADPAAAGGGTP